jgi:maltose O-acetyltransferase
MTVAARLWLRGATLGARPTTVGRPHVRRQGTLVVGDDFVLRSLPVQSHMLIGPTGKLAIGDRVAIDHGAAISCFSEVSIGDDVRVGPFSVILDSDFHEVGDHSAFGTPKPITIGRRCRLGPHVTVLRGATIGEGSIIEPGSTVSRAIPPGVRAGGVPARVLGPAATRRDLGELVPHVVMTALRLAEPPQLHTPRKLLPRWDALAGARIAALLKEELEMPLPREEIAAATSVAEVLARVSAAL